MIKADDMKEDKQSISKDEFAQPNSPRMTNLNGAEQRNQIPSSRNSLKPQFQAIEQNQNFQPPLYTKLMSAVDPVPETQSMPDTNPVDAHIYPYSSCTCNQQNVSPCGTGNPYPYMFRLKVEPKYNNTTCPTNSCTYEQQMGCRCGR